MSLRDIIWIPVIFCASIRFGVIIVESGIRSALKDSKASGRRSFPPVPADRIGFMDNWDLRPFQYPTNSFNIWFIIDHSDFNSIWWHVEND